jgi:3-oxoacyl-[acyl-carrier protein] reductase
MDRSELKGRVAVVTGGSRGIGKGICVALAEAGAHIVFSYSSNQDAAERTVELVRSFNVNCIAVQANAGCKDDVADMARKVHQEFGRINILVNNAGTIGRECPVADMPVDEWDHLISIDLRGVFLSAKYFIPLIDTHPVGKIINITSELSKKGRPNFAHYCAAKGGINSFTRSLALELAPQILVNAIAPGPVATDMITADMEPEWVEKEKDIPLQRLGTVEEIAAVALLLASDKGNFFCGQIISPNGGAVFF